MSNYYKVDENRIRMLRSVADQLGCVQELQALCMLYGLRSMQGAAEDMLKGGDIDADDLPNKAGCEEQAAEFLHDTLCNEEFMEVARVNDLGDYSIKVVPIVTIVKSI